MSLVGEGVFGGVVVVDYLYVLGGGGWVVEFVEVLFFVVGLFFVGGLYVMILDW